MSDESGLVLQLTNTLIAANETVLAGHAVIVQQAAEIETLRGALQAATELIDWLCENGYIVASHFDPWPDVRIQTWRDAAGRLLSGGNE